MDSYIIIYETTTKNADFMAYIKTLSNWGRITDNSWVVKTVKTATQIRDDLNNLKAPGDRIMVVKSGYVAAWNNVRADNDWLIGHL